MKSKLKRIINLLLSPNNPIELVLFNLMVLTGILGTIVSFIFSVFIESLFWQNIFTVTILVVLFLCLVLANRFNKTQLASIILLVMCSFVFFPLMFFSGGGHLSGMSSWFSLVIIFNFLMINGTPFYIILVLQILTYICLFYVSSQMPQAIIHMTYNQVVIDMLVALVTTSLVIGGIIKFQRIIYNKIFKNLQNQKEELRKAEQKAENASRAKSDFLSSMSHEIRTPINAVLGMNEMILRESTEKKILEYASSVQSSGNALLSLINDILDISKIESGKIELIKTDYNLKDLIIQCYNLVSPRTEKKGLSFKVKCEKDLPSVYNGDQTHIRQILINLLTNAAKYTEYGRVDFEIYGLRENDVEKICFAVKDTGIGISKDDIDKLFTKFNRVDIKHNRNIEGTGLGLSISKQLAELMGGSIEVKSKLGKGSEFIFKLSQEIVSEDPVGEVNPVPKAEKKVYVYHQSFEAPDARILAVDDVDLNLIVFENLLKETKMKIDVCTSGQEALQKLSENKYDVIFMDHMMPEMDGIETLRNLHKMETLNMNVPVIMLTANALSGVKEEYLSEGFSDYISKPIDGKALEEMLLKYLPREKVIEFNHADDFVNSKLSVFRKTYPEFDYEVALEYCGDNDEFISELLYDYYEENRFEQLKAAYSEKDWIEYRAHLHAIRGASMVVGLVKLSGLFQEQEIRIKDELFDIADGEHICVMTAYKVVLEKIKEAGLTVKDE